MRHTIREQGRGGFSMIELVIVIAIIVMISATVLVSFTGTRERAAINSSAQSIALAIRSAQNKSFSVVQITTNGVLQTPPAVGVRLDAGSSIFFLFADLVHDNVYSAVPVGSLADAKISPGDMTLPSGTIVRSFTYYDAGGNPRRGVSAAHVMFTPPEASILFTDSSGNPLGDTLQIELASASGALHKTITVRTSGQVSIQ